MVDLAPVILGPLVVWQWLRASTRKMSDAEATILGALGAAPGETLTEAQLQRFNLSDQDLALALDRLQHCISRANGRVTLR